MAFSICDSECIGLVLPLKSDFELAFGKFHALARVLVRVVAESAGKRFVGHGEASIDFPFAPYDGFDMLHALETTPLSDLQVDDRREVLDDLVCVSEALARCPAALCALNEAFDDIEAQVRGIPAVALYGPVRPFARCMHSIGFPSRPGELRDQILLVLAEGQTPKPKVGAGLTGDVETIATVEALAHQFGFRYMLDFNGAYKPEEFASLVDLLTTSGHLPRHALAIEQPSAADLGIDGLVQSRGILRAHGLGSIVIADESFVNGDDGVECAAAGIGLNYKIQKVGGVLRALAIERRVAEAVASPPPCMVGGTFPTALGRAYDRVAARVLTSATLPADGWLPAASYFDGDRDLAASADARAPRSPVIVGGRGDVSGIGVLLDEKRVQRWTVSDFRAMYAAVRGGLSSAPSLIELHGSRYADLYLQRAHRPITWNLAEAAA